jgi:hypothetical protein
MDERTTDVQRACERSLRELRQDIGCTPERLMECPELLSILQERIAGLGYQVTIQASIEELKRVVGSLSDPKYREPLLVALHFSSEHRGRTLTDRRRGYIAVLQQARSPLAADIRTLERRENKGINLAARLLVEGYKAKISLPSVSEVSTRSTSSFSKDLAIEAISHTYYFSPIGVVTHQEITRWVRAVTPKANPRIVSSNRYFSESRPDVLRIESIYGCRVVDRNEDTGGGVLTTLEIFKILNLEDGIYPFSCRLLVDSNIRCEPVVRWRPPVHEAKRIEFRLNFDPAMKPVRAWWFRAALDIEGQIEPEIAENRHLDILDDGQYIYKVFEGGALAPGRYYGVAWIWP